MPASSVLANKTAFNADGRESRAHEQLVRLVVRDRIIILYGGCWLRRTRVGSDHVVRSMRRRNRSERWNGFKIAVTPGMDITTVPNTNSIQ